MKRNLLVIIGCLMFIVFQSNAQQTSLEGILTTIQSRNFGPILENNVVKGYYGFYKTDRVNKKEGRFNLVIFDQNLNKISEEEFVARNTTRLKDVVYNGSHLLVKMENFIEKNIRYKIYDFDAAVVRNYTDDMNKAESASSTLEVGASRLKPVEGSGFVEYRTQKNKKLGYTIYFHSNTDASKDWSYSSDSTSKVLETAVLLHSDKNFIVSSLEQRPTKTSLKFKYSALVLDANTGKELFVESLEDENYEISPSSAYIAGENIAFFGFYYEKGKTPINSKSLGLVSVVFDPKGKLVSKKFVSWVDDISKFVDVKGNNKVKGAGNVYFHNIVTTSDGKIYAIGEQFRKQLSAGGIALTALGSKTSKIEVLLQDLMVFEFSNTFELEHVRIVDKPKERVYMPEGMGMLVGPHLMAFYLDYMGWFSYAHTQTNDDLSAFSILYLGREKIKGAPNKYIAGVASYTDGEYSRDKITLKTTKDNDISVSIFPGKAGHIMIMEYNLKTRTLDLRLEKFNY